MKISRRLALSMLWIAAIIWGAGFVATKMALDAGATPFQVLAGRFFVGSMFLNAIFYKHLKTITLKDIRRNLGVGIYLFLGFATQTYGLNYTTPSISAFVTANYVVMVPFLAFILYKKKIDAYAIWGCVLAVVGIAMISLNEKLSFSLGVPLTLFAAAFYAIQIILTDEVLADTDPIHCTLIMLNVCAIISILFVGGSAALFHDLPQITAGLVTSLVLLGIFSTGVAYILINIAQKYTSAISVAIICSTESIFSMILSVIIMNEIITMPMMIGAVLVFVAIIVSETKLSFLKKSEMSVKP